jgi:hypothetical protein
MRSNDASLHRCIKECFSRERAGIVKKSANFTAGFVNLGSSVKDKETVRASRLGQP